MCFTIQSDKILELYSVGQFGTDKSIVQSSNGMTLGQEVVDKAKR